MRARTGVLVFWAALALLAAAGAYFAAIYEPEASSSDPPVKRERAARIRRPAHVPGAGGLLDRWRNQDHRAAQEIRPTASAERTLAPDIPRRLVIDRAAAESIARRFFAAFARYELGELDPCIEASLRATATGAFARELIATPPRIPQPVRELGVAVLRRLEFVPGQIDGRKDGLLTAELVGSVERGGERTPIAIELAREGGEWRVAGIGR